MKSYLLPVLVATLIGLGADPAMGQRGRGEDIGLARQGVNPPIETVTGTIDDLLIQPCAMTTGRSIVGAHVIIATEDRGELNVHLGPATELTDLINDLQKGDAITAAVFRTANLPDGQAIATEVAVDGASYLLRDETLRPVWAGTRSGRGVNRPMRGRGPGRGWN